MSAPIAIFTSCSELDPKSIIKQVLKNEELPPAEKLVEDIEAYPWHVDTKYYTADINVCSMYNRTIGNEEFAENVCAFIVHFDSSKADGLDKVKMWKPFLKEFQAEVQILVCDRCSDEGISKQVAWAWCLDNSFELVELDPLVEPDDSQDDEDDFQETVGVERIVQALHAHTWPNLVMKDEPSFRSPFMKKMMEEEAEQKQTSRDNHLSSATSSDKDIQTNQNSENRLDSSNKDSETAAKSEDSVQTNKSDSDLLGLPGLDADHIDVLSGLSNEEADQDQFEQLFSQLRIMKERADDLPLDQRKAYAEQVALQFWKAIGGDEDEIAGLDDSD